MRAATAGMITLLNTGRQFFVADLYTITLYDGTILRYTSADIDLTVGANTFLSADPNGGAPILKRSRCKWSLGLQTNTLEVKIIAYLLHTINGIPWMQFIRNGGLDGARIELDRLITDSWADTSRGVLRWFAGNVSDVEVSRTEASLSVKDDLELLNIKLPKEIYQPGCRFTLFDPGCGLNKNSFALARTVNASSTTTRLLTSSAGQAAGYFDSGYLFFTTGPNAGAQRTVRKWDGLGLDLALPLPYTPVTGNAFTIYPGCDKKQLTCQVKFNNLIKFGGQPYVPVPETAV